METSEIIHKKKVFAPKLRFKGFAESWKMKPLIELSVNGFSNGAFNDPKKVGSGYRIINVKDMYIDGTIKVDTLTRVALDEKEFSKNRVEYGDIFFTRSSLVKEGIAYSNVNLNEVDDLTYDGHLIRMRPNRELHSPVFLYYNFATKTARLQFIKRGKTATMTTIGQEDIAKVEIIFPTLPEQQKIASFLTSIDEKIQLLNRKKELLEQYKKGVMQQLFSGKLRFKDENGKAYTKWEEKRLGDVADIIGGGTPDTLVPEYWDGEIQWYTPTEISERFVSKSKRTISKLGLEKSSARLLPSGTILFTSRATIAELSFSKEECTTNQGFQSLIVNEKNNSEFIFYWIKNNKKAFIRKSQGSTFLEISKNEMQKIRIAAPSLDEQKRIGTFLSAIDVKIENINVQITQTQNFKKGLLQQMFV